LVEQRVQNTGGRRWQPVMLTLTYADAGTFQARQITGLLKNMRDWSARRGFRLPYVWVLERGSLRGRLHYHVLLWLPPGITLPKPDKRGWWRHGWTRTERARCAVGYLAKYASKGGGESYPPGIRIHGCGGLVVGERSERAWWLSPAWVRELWPEWSDEPRRAVGGGWSSKRTGEWVPSPWVVTGFAGPWVRIEPRG
jgi:hypothetical protein